MSRIGRQPIAFDGKLLQVKVEGQRVVVAREKDKLEAVVELPAGITARLDDSQIVVERASDGRQHRSLHGLSRTLVANAIEGLVKGFEKVLEVYGVGFRVTQQGEKLTMQLGFSHPVEVHPPQGIAMRIETFTPTQENSYLSARIYVQGTDKSVVGQLAAKIRAVRKPEPYKGKGIRYRGEYVRRKAGKAAKATGK